MKLVVYIVALFCLMGLVFATAPSESDTIAYYKLEDLTDEIGTYGLTNDAASSGATGIINDAYDFSDTGSLLYNNNGIVDFGSPWSINVWFNADTLGSQDRIIMHVGEYPDKHATLKYASTGIIGVRAYDVGSSSALITKSSTSFTDTSGWHMATVTWDGSSTGKLYLDGVEQTGSTNVGGFLSNGYTHIGARDTKAVPFDGRIDEIAVFDVALTSDNVDYLFDSGSPWVAQQHPYSNEADYYNLTVFDAYSGDYIDVFNITDGSSTYATSEGEIIIYINESDGKTIPDGDFSTHLSGGDSGVGSWTVDSPDHFSKNYELNISGGVIENKSLYQSNISFGATRLYYNDSVSDVDFYINGSNDTRSYLSEGFYNITAVHPDYFNKSAILNVSPLDIKNFTVKGLFQSYFNISLIDVVTGDVVEVDSYLDVSAGFGNLSFTNSLGAFEFPALFESYDIEAVAKDYAVAYDVVSVSDSALFHNISLYANNSVWVESFDLDDGSQLFNFTIELFNDNFSISESDNNTGVARLNNISSGVYNLQVSKGGYVDGEYTLTMTGGSHQTLNTYLLQEGSSVVMTVVDVISGANIEGATVSMYKTVNGSWTLVSGQQSDLTGRVQFTYIPETDYKFIIDMEGYEQRVFTLEPLFSTYTVGLTPEGTQETSDNTGDWFFSINNSGLFYNNKNNSFSVSVASGLGTLERYEINISFPGGVFFNDVCVDAQGCVHSHVAEIIEASQSDRVAVSYAVKESGRSYRSFNKEYKIIHAADGDTLLEGEGLDDLSAALLSSLLALVLVGVVATVSYMVAINPLIPSSLVLIVLFYGFGLAGLIPMVAAYAVLAGGLLLLLLGLGGVGQ